MLSEELKKPKEVQPTEIQVESTTPVAVSSIDLVSQYLSKKRVASETAIITEANNNIEEAVTNPANIEKQRWADPLVPLDQKFVTVKDMNDHYTKFLARIQQQMSSIGGGGEVKFRGLDDVVTSTTGTNKFLTYNPSTKKFYFDYFGPATETEIGGIIPGPGFTIDVDGTLGLNAGPMFELDGSDVFQLKVATETEFGGVKLGPGVTTNGAGQIIIDSTGLDFSFGDFGATVGKYSSNTDYAILQSINVNEDIVLASNGTGSIKVVGEFKVHSTNGELTETLESGPAFIVKADGQVAMYVTQNDAQLGAVEIIGSDTGDVVAPGIDGTMLHITGQRADPCRVYIDGNGDYVSLVARRWNGNFTDGRSAVLANEYVLRINATAQTDAGLGNVAMAQISIQALENQTTTAQGSKITFTATPIGSPASARVDVMNVTTANGVSATKFTGPLIGNADTATTATNLAAATSILAGSISIDPASVTKNSASTQTFTLSGITTSHKIVITPGTAFPFGLIIASAWASATNTLSITFHNYSTADVDQGLSDIRYFAWI